MVFDRIVRGNEFREIERRIATSVLEHRVRFVQMQTDDLTFHFGHEYLRGETTVGLRSEMKNVVAIGQTDGHERNDQKQHERDVVSLRIGAHTISGHSLEERMS